MSQHRYHHFGVRAMTGRYDRRDWVLSPQAMDRYLAHRLYIVETQIDRLIVDLEHQAGPPFPVDLDDESLPEETWASWASLNYLLHARDSLRDALSRPGRLTN